MVYLCNNRLVASSIEYEENVFAKEQLPYINLRERLGQSGELCNLHLYNIDWIYKYLTPSERVYSILCPLCFRQVILHKKFTHELNDLKEYFKCLSTSYFKEQFIQELFIPLLLDEAKEKDIKNLYIAIGSIDLSKMDTAELAKLYQKLEPY